MLTSKKFYQDAKKAVVVSVYKLSPDEMTHLKTLFPILKEVDIENVVDQSIIGGLVIQYRSRLIDLSLKSQLKKLKQKIYENF